MAYFRWHGITSTGQESSGLIAAPNLEAANLVLMYRSIAVLRINQSIHQSMRARRRFIVELIAKLALLTSHGLTLHKALDIAALQTSDSYNKANINALLADSGSGIPFAESIEDQFPETSSYVIGLIKSGEEGGRMSTILHILSQHFEHQAALRKKIIAAITPPLLTLAFTIAIILALLIGVVPQFERLFLVLDKPIPAATASLIALAHFLTSAQCCLLSTTIVLAGYSIYHIVRRKKLLSTLCNKALVSTPFIGQIIVKLQCSRFLNMVGILSDAGLPLHRAAALALTSVTNSTVKMWLLAVTTNLTLGNSLVQSITKIPGKLGNLLADLLTPTTILGVKQKTLQLAVETLDQDALKSMSKVIALIGPLLIIGVGCIIFALLIFLYLPLFSLANSI